LINSIIRINVSIITVVTTLKCCVKSFCSLSLGTVLDLKNRIIFSTMRSTEVKKEKVLKRLNKLDPNNNKNRKDRPVVKRRGKKIRDDGFEHRTSPETK